MDQNLRLTPQLKPQLTQALQRALEILQLPQAELAVVLREEIEKNPLLEEVPVSSSGSRSTMPEVEAPVSLHEHLLAQIREALPDPSSREIGEQFLEQLDERGFLPEEVKGSGILSTLQTLDPPGIFARNLRECFLLQLARKPLHPLTHKLVMVAFDDLLQGRYSVVKKKLGVEGLELQQAIQQLARLSTRPTAGFQRTVAQPIVPDLQFVKHEGKWVVTSLEENLPRFRLCAEYSGLNDSTVRGFKASAQWLIRSMQRRRKMLLELGSHLVKLQAPFLNQQGPLVAVSAVELAQLLGVHESTISRALNDKYAATPRGLIPLKALVPSVENVSAKDVLQRLVGQEDKASPLTDDQLAVALTKAGHVTARRTVAKYRKQLRIGSATVRKHGRT